MYIIDKRAGSAGDEEVEAVCPFDSASVAPKTDELTVHTKPSGQGGHLGRRETEKLVSSCVLSDPRGSNQSRSVEKADTDVWHRSGIVVVCWLLLSRCSLLGTAPLHEGGL